MAYISIDELREGSCCAHKALFQPATLPNCRNAARWRTPMACFLTRHGKALDLPLSRRTITLGLEYLRQTYTVALAAEFSILEAMKGFLASGVALVLIIDGDTAIALLNGSDPGATIHMWPAYRLARRAGVHGTR